LSVHATHPKELLTKQLAHQYCPYGEKAARR
jgi:hypothetical protein